MNDPLITRPTRRQFIKTAAAASALAGVKIPAVFAEDRQARAPRRGA
ncbi:MAG: twin-arginine translocation signal domain-containing protein, partial [Chthoniobacter sp.]